MKLFIFGIDGASFEIINGLIKKGYLKNFKKLMDKGSYANMIAIPPKTIPMWPALFSGLNPLQMGFFDFFQNGKLFDSNVIKGKTIFDIMYDKNKFILNLQGGSPCWKTKRYMVAGEHALEINTYPKDFKNKTIFDDYILHERGKDLNHCLLAFERRIKLVKYLMKKEKFDFCLFASTFSETAINHLPRTSPTGKEYTEAYERIDKFLGELIENPNIDNIIIVSDHGTKRYSHQFNIKRFLEKKDLMKQGISKYKNLLFWLGGKLGIAKQIMILYIRMPKFKSKKRKGKEKIKNFYASSSNFGTIYEPDKNKLNNLINLLKKESFIRKIYNTKDLYGEEKKNFPQIIIELKDNILFNVNQHCFEYYKFDQLGHSKKGIFIAYGKDINSSGKINDVSYLDISPTILRLFNYAKAGWMKGKSIDKIFKDRIIKSQPTKKEPIKTDYIIEKIKI